MASFDDVLLHESSSKAQARLGELRLVVHIGCQDDRIAGFKPQLSARVAAADSYLEKAATADKSEWLAGRDLAIGATHREPLSVHQQSYRQGQAPRRTVGCPQGIKDQYLWAPPKQTQVGDSVSKMVKMEDLTAPPMRRLKPNFGKVKSLPFQDGRAQSFPRNTSCQVRRDRAKDITTVKSVADDLRLPVEFWIVKHHSPLDVARH
jgi:hypothetical protein